MLCYIILNFNDYDTTSKVVKDIGEYSCIDKIIIVDNNSTDGTFEKLQRFKSKRIDVIKTEKNGGYGYGNNFGVYYAKRKYDPEFIVISNPDVTIAESSINCCIDFLSHNQDCSIVSLLMKNLDGSNNYKCAWKCPTFFEYLCFSTVLGRKVNFNYAKSDFKNEVLRCDCVAGSWLMIRTDDFISIGGYDENIFLYCEETVLGIKAKANNLKTFLLPQDSFLHAHSVSISKTYKKKLDQQKLMWESREYVLEHYYQKFPGKKIIIKIFKRYALTERKLVYIFKSIKGVIFSHKNNNE